jgi:hypothetical protein
LDGFAFVVQDHFLKKYSFYIFLSYKK